MILSDLATHGIIDDPSLAVATSDSPDGLNIDTGVKKSRQHMQGLTKSVDRRHINDEFVSVLALINVL